MLSRKLWLNCFVETVAHEFVFCFKSKIKELAQKEWNVGYFYTLERETEQVVTSNTRAK